MTYKPEQDPSPLEIANIRLAQMQESNAWQQIADLTHPEPTPLTAEEGLLTGADVGRVIDAIADFPTQDLARLAVSNTLAFAHQVLEAARDSYRRRGVTLLNEAEDLPPPDSDAAKMTAAYQEQHAQVVENSQIPVLLQARQELPWEKSDNARLIPGAKDMFYGLAQLLGMVMANTLPTDLIGQMRNGHITGLTVRDKALLVHHREIAALLEQNEITGYLAKFMLVDGPRAVEVAVELDPVPAVAFRAAKQLIIAGTT